MWWRCMHHHRDYEVPDIGYYGTRTRGKNEAGVPHILYLLVRCQVISRLV